MGTVAETTGSLQLDPEVGGRERGQEREREVCLSGWGTGKDTSLEKLQGLPPMAHVVQTRPDLLILPKQSHLLETKYSNM